jgi:DNA-binding GntR family transcriptional regulator
MDRDVRGRRNVKAPRSRQSLTDRVYTELRRQIIWLELPPGARFTEGEVTRMLGIGKTPVREALARLVQRRLARNIPRVGYEVAPVTLLDVQQICELRLIVEPEAARLAIGRVDGALIRELDQRCISTYVHDGTSDMQDFIDANHQFHLAVAAASGNDRLLEVVEHLLDESERLYRIGLRLQVNPEEQVHKHEDLVDSLVAGDGDRAVAITREQIGEFRQLVIDALLATSSIMSAPVGLPDIGQRARPLIAVAAMTRVAELGPNAPANPGNSGAILVPRR